MLRSCQECGERSIPGSDYCRPCRKSRYKAYLKSPAWKKRRRDAIKRAKSKCVHCGAQRKALNVHHRTYENLFNEKPEDLEVLCIKCHEFVHGLTKNCRSPKPPGRQQGNRRRPEVVRQIRETMPDDIKIKIDAVTWLKARTKALRKAKSRCSTCGVRAFDVIHTHPELAGTKHDDPKYVVPMCITCRRKRVDRVSQQD